MNARTVNTVHQPVRTASELMALLAVKANPHVPTMAIPVAIGKYDDSIPVTGTRRAARLDRSGFVI